MTIVLAKYKRSSTDNQDLILQDEVLEKYIARLKEDKPDMTYEILNFEDHAVSGKNIERESLKKMLELVEAKKINLVIFTKIDRLARSIKDLLNIASIFEKNNVQFRAIEQNVDTSTSQGRLNFQLLGIFAEFERNVIRERMLNGRKRAELVGTKSGKACHRPRVKLDYDGVIFKHNKGMSMNKISKEYKVSITPVRRIINEYKSRNENGSITRPQQ